MKNQLSANLVALMGHHHIGGVQLARATNIPLSTIKNIRKGTNVNPTIETLVPLAQYFNVSIEDIISSDCIIKAKKKNLSQNDSKVVPVISWEEAIYWSQIGASNSQIFTEKMCSQYTFALPSEQNSSELFAAPGVFLIDPKQEPAHLDYILVHKLGLGRASIKQIICDEESNYLRSLVITSKLESFDDNYRLLGVIIEYRQFVKSLNDDKAEEIINKYMSNNKKPAEFVS